ncbi:MAG: radical SAM protein [Acidobacteria bacterium]|jgi:radical SAM protein with 4Fe4S-binding SPASM domain|nr:radical SAM protein [Acidobacteriota bacterium]
MNTKKIQKEILTKYPGLPKGTRVIITKEISQIISPGIKAININNEAAKLVSRFNSLKMIPEILEDILLRKPHQEEISNTISFINQLVEKKLVTLFDEPVEDNIDIKGTFDKIYPQVINLELTNKCNFNCRYCYQNSSLKQDKFLKDSLKILEFFKNMNVLGFELSGGEPLLHPQIEEIISYIIENFSIIGLITNGSLLQVKHLELLKSNTCKVGIQICLDGNTPEIVESTTGVKGSFEMEIEAIKLVKSYNHTLRIGMVIDTPQKIDAIEDTLLIAKKLGADSFVPNPFIDFGRGKDLINRFKPEDYLRLNNKLQELVLKYKGFIAREIEIGKFKFNTLHNCGAGHKNFVLNWDGVIKPCPLIGAEFLCIGKWSDIETEKNQDLFKAYFELEAPKKETCGNCEYLSYCLNCITRGLSAYEKNKDNCYWYKKYEFLIKKIKRLK